MSGTIRRPDQGVDISGLSRRLDILERRTTPRLAAASGFGSDPDHQIGSFVWFQTTMDVPNDTLTRPAWADPGDVLMSEDHPGTTPFWVVPNPDTGYGVGYAPGVYEVTAALGINDVPATAAGKAVALDLNGWPNRFVITIEEAAAGSATLAYTFVAVVVRPDLGWVPFDFGSGDLRIRHALGETLDGVYVSLIAQKIGHVD